MTDSTASGQVGLTGRGGSQVCWTSRRWLVRPPALGAPLQVLFVSPHQAPPGRKACRVDRDCVCKSPLLRACVCPSVSLGRCGGDTAPIHRRRAGAPSCSPKVAPAPPPPSHCSDQETFWGHAQVPRVGGTRRCAGPAFLWVPDVRAGGPCCPLSLRPGSHVARD